MNASSARRLGLGLGFVALAFAGCQDAGDQLVDGNGESSSFGSDGGGTEDGGSGESSSGGDSTTAGSTTGDGDGTSGGDGDGSWGDGDGTTGTGDGDGATSGDGDGTTSSTGDGTTGDGDGTTGDGDGTTGDGDGDPTCNTLDPVTLYLSPDDSNSMASPVIVRERAGGSLSGVTPRPWEWMNYYDFDYPAPPSGELDIHLAMVQDDPGTGEYRMQIAVTSEDMTSDTRPPMNVTLVLDTSGSMAGAPIDMLKQSCRSIASSLRAGDTVSMLEWDVGQVFTFSGLAVSGPNDPTLLAAIDALSAGGGTNLNGGLTTGYSLAQANYDSDAVNRLVLISDGGANAGITDVNIIAQNTVFGGADGIYLVGVGVGTGAGYNDSLMDTVTDAGKGAAVYINDIVEANKIFGAQFENTMAIAAREVQVQLDMPPGFEIKKFSGEEFGGNPNEIEPQHLAPNDSMVFHQVVETCDPDSVTPDTEFTITARWLDPWSFTTREISRTATFSEMFAGDIPLLRKGEAIAAAGEALTAVKQWNYGLIPEAEQKVADALQANPGDPDLLEVQLVLAAY